MSDQHQVSTASALTDEQFRSLVQNGTPFKFNLTHEQFSMVLQTPVAFALTEAQLRLLAEFAFSKLPSPATGNHEVINTAIAIPEFVPPKDSAGDPSPKSLFESFPFISRANILEIVRHEFDPFHLCKLDIATQDTIIRMGAAIDYYPTLSSLLEPLLTYFDVLGSHAASSGNNTAATLAILKGCTAYCASLSKLNAKFEWSAVLFYHKHFFMKRSREMMRGIYSGWTVLDESYMIEYLLPNPRKTSAPRSRNSRRR